jgi:hypothetical protein
MVVPKTARMTVSMSADSETLGHTISERTADHDMVATSATAT